MTPHLTSDLHIHVHADTPKERTNCFLKYTQLKMFWPAVEKPHVSIVRRAKKQSPGLSFNQTLSINKGETTNTGDSMDFKNVLPSQRNHAVMKKMQKGSIYVRLEIKQDQFIDINLSGWEGLKRWF